MEESATTKDEKALVQYWRHGCAKLIRGAMKKLPYLSFEGRVFLGMSVPTSDNRETGAGGCPKRSQAEPFVAAEICQGRQ